MLRTHTTSKSSIAQQTTDDDRQRDPKTETPCTQGYSCKGVRDTKTTGTRQTDDTTDRRRPAQRRQTRDDRRRQRKQTDEPERTRGRQTDRPTNAPWSHMSLFVRFCRVVEALRMLLRCLLSSLCVCMMMIMRSSSPIVSGIACLLWCVCVCTVCVQANPWGFWLKVAIGLRLQCARVRAYRKQYPSSYPPFSALRLAAYAKLYFIILRGRQENHTWR